MALLFDSALSQELTLAGNLGGVQNPLTFACWFRSSSQSTSQAMMCLSDTGGTSGGTYLLMAEGNVVGDPIRARKENDNASGGNADTTTGYVADVWSSACGVFTSNTLREAYLNGSSVGSNTTNTINPTTDVFRIGSRKLTGAADLFFSGQIAHAVVWREALTAAEVIKLHLGRSPLEIRPRDLVAYWPMNNPANPYVDVVGGYHLTPSSSAPTFRPDPYFWPQRSRERRVWVEVAGGGGKGFLFPSPMRGFIHMLVR